MSSLAVRYGFIVGRGVCQKIHHLPLTIENIAKSQHSIVSHSKMHKTKAPKFHMPLRAIYSNISTPCYKHIKELDAAVAICGMKLKDLDWHVVLLE